MSDVVGHLRPVIKQADRLTDCCCSLQLSAVSCPTAIASGTPYTCTFTTSNSSDFTRNPIFISVSGGYTTAVSVPGIDSGIQVSEWPIDVSRAGQDATASAS